MEITEKGIKDVLPDKYSPSNTVYEYGGSLYDVTYDGRLIFSNSDNTVQILDPDTGKVSLLQDSPVLRYCGFSSSKVSPWVLAIEEDHTNPGPTEVVDCLVAINVNTYEIKKVAQGADFYYLPSFSYDGNQITWLEWDRPDLLFDSCRMLRASFNEGGIVTDVEIVAGVNNESVTEPRWGPDGALYFCMESEGRNYRELFRIPPGSHNPKKIKLNGLNETEFGEVRLFEGSHTYIPLNETYIMAAGCTNGTSQLITINVETNHWKPAAPLKTLSHIYFDAMARLSDTSVLVFGPGQESLFALHKVDMRGPEHYQLIRSSAEVEFHHSWFSKPSHIEVPSTENPERKIHGFLWLPRNPKYAASEDELPPLVISVHGGPTGYSGNGLTLRTQYFTSRGYAYLLINYSGSTGHGREYRQSLFGNWGTLDADDSADVAKYLSNQGVVKAGAVGVTGISAGGYNTLQSLTRHPKTFAGGFCVSGISDLLLFDDRTHKLEYDYAPALVLPNFGKDVSEDEKKKIYAERSAYYQFEHIKAPLFMLHGMADTVVPLEQATRLVDAMEEKGKDVDIIAVEGEGHMMGKPESSRLWLEEEEKWWQKTLLSRE